MCEAPNLTYSMVFLPNISKGGPEGPEPYGVTLMVPQLLGLSNITLSGPRPELGILGSVSKAPKYCLEDCATKKKNIVNDMCTEV